MMKSWLMATTVLMLMSGVAFAQTSAGPPVMAPSSVMTPAGPGLVSGAPGSPQTVMIPGSAVPGLLLNNGNGTSSLMVPGGPSQLVPTPR